ncbi:MULTISPECIES: S-layer homology domain-containing protein [Solibacillus]|uniref:S-layer homology domain-containing protein n=1 Tax=Solibacillus merdavium TaxID=2762218 RepID=A0ABR8XHX5_9BACL|nr:S-layer homology domain-containing protein [Solibacillus merdavium]MBD8031540.1 S-layer homology domain-containing protein [Solibacillus merdavium]
MKIYKKWLSIAIIFILSFSLLSPAAIVKGQGFEAEESNATSSTYNHDEQSLHPNDETSKNAPSLPTTSDSAQINSSNLSEVLPSGYVTVSVEKFTLGQGYAIDPIQVPFYEGEMAGQVVARVLGSGNYNNGMDEENISYLANIKDAESTVNIPTYIQKEILKSGSTIGARTNSDWLGQFDYTDMSGWMYTANHKLPDVGMSEYEVTDGSVIRLQFTVYGYGGDLGFSFELPYIEVANKDRLTAKVAEINSNPDKGVILANQSVKSAYDAAYEQLKDMESSQTNIDDALKQLEAALEGQVDVIITDKTVLQTAVNTAEVNKDSVKISSNGKDVEPIEYWVTQAEFDAYTNIIVSAQQLIADQAVIQDTIDAKVLALNQATDSFNAVKKEGLKNAVPTVNEVKFTIAPKTVTFKLFDANNQEVNIGTGVVGTYKVYTANLQAGDYRYEGFDSSEKSVGGGKLTVTTEPKQEYQFRQLNFKATNTNWKVGNDYTIKVGLDSYDDTSLKFGDELSSGHIPVLGLTGKTYFYSFEPISTHKEYTALKNSITVTIAGSAQSISGSIPFSGNVTFTVPLEAELFLGRKIKHFISFEEIKPEGEATVNSNGTKTFSYKLANNGQYNYRVSQEGKLTNTGIFTANAQNAALEVTQKQLDILSPRAVLNKGTHFEGNIYLNINEQNHLKLSQGDNFKLLPLRSWQALIDGITNYFFEPDFNYEIITGNDVVEIEPGKPGSYAIVKAIKNGTAIVKVTYDALKVNGSTDIKAADDAYSAIWPENVGVFVVTVGQGKTGISTGIESNKERNQKANEKKVNNLQNGIYDADIDSVYYVKGEPGAFFKFTPTANSTVSILRPEINHAAGTVSYGNAEFSTENITLNEDGSYTVLLTEGRNIVKVEKDGKAEYHVMTARPLDITIENVTNPNGEIAAGDKVKVTFKGISFPANKLSGIYNFRGQLKYLGGNNHTSIVGQAVQYNMTTIGNSITFTIPEDYEGEYSLHDGHIQLSFFGSPIGDHRNINPTVGANPNFAASEIEAYYGIFPKITIIDGPVDKTKLQTSIIEAGVNKDSVKISNDGKDIDPTEYWVTQAEVDTYTNIIVSAQQLLADENKTQVAIDAKVLALNQSTETFNQAKKLGAKSKVIIPTQQAYNTVGKYMIDKLPNPKFGSEWWIITLARGGYEVPESYYNTYYNNVVDYVISKNGDLDQRKYTEYSRLIIALTAIGKDPSNVGGYNLIEKLSDYDKVVWQGVNGAYFALIALDTWGFDLPNSATTTREKLIDFILDKQLADKGWALSGTKADPDMTGMAIQSLAPYYNSNPQVKESVDHALATLSAIQEENGGYKSWNTENAESAAQVITALASLGIDANQDPRFNKVISNIMTYYSKEDGGFKHVLTETKANGMATEQVGYTLAAYHRLLNGQTALYDMTDTKQNNPSNPGNGGNNPSNPGDDENNPSKPGDSENGSKPGAGGGNNSPGGNLAYGKTTFLIKISSSEIPLRATTVDLFPGETVVDVLKRVTAENGISLSYRETQYGTYIEGIAGLYEFDRGPLSGWMYRVNGSFPSYSAGIYTLSPGDTVEWLYTLDLGKDIGGYVDGIENGSAPGATPGGGAECKDETKDCKEKNKCTDEDKQCTEEPSKDEDSEEESKENTKAEITVEDGSDKAFITAENIQKYLENDMQTLVIKINGKNLELPTSSLKSIILAEDEKLVASIVSSTESKEFTVNFGVETSQGQIKPISLGKEYVKVTLPADEVKPNTVVLQLIDGEYKPVPHKVINGEIVLFTKISGTFVIIEKQVTFKDIEKLANKDEIEFLASRLIIQGKTPETFEPNKPITRAQFAALVSRALGLQTSGENPFNDTSGKWYEKDIQALFEAGITKGTTASTFNPEAPITRQQAAAFTGRILEYLNVMAKENGDIHFKDANRISAEYLRYIELLSSLDIMTGKEDGTFDPRESLTRSQTAKILKRALTIADMM